MSVQVQRGAQRPNPGSPSEEDPTTPTGNGKPAARSVSPEATASEQQAQSASSPVVTAPPPSVAPDGVAPPVIPVPVAASDPGAAPVRRRPALLTRRVLIPLALVILVGAAIFGFNAYREGQLYVSTDNAQLTAQPVQVGSMNPGRVEAILPSIGAHVQKGDVVAQVALPSQVGTGQNGQPKLGFLGVGDTHVDVQAPLDGIVIGEPVAAGTTVAAGQPIVSIVDPTQLYVNANIEETNIAKVKVGQRVTVHVDALGADVPGKVEVITPATASSSSILPTSNASGNFTKVTQLVPVRVSVNLGNQPFLLGANVEVKIRVAD